MNLLKVFGFGIIICSISESYSAASITLDFIHNNEYKVSMCSDSVNKSETFYKLEEFPQKLHDVTGGLLSAESVSVSNDYYCKFGVNCKKPFNIDMKGKSLSDTAKENPKVCNYTSGWHKVILYGVNSDNSKPIKLFINGTDDSREEIEFNCGKNIVKFPDITVNHPGGLSIYTKLDCVITSDDDPIYTQIAYNHKICQGTLIEPNEKQGFETTLDFMEYSKIHNFNTTPNVELPKDYVISCKNFVVNCK